MTEKGEEPTDLETITAVSERLQLNKNTLWSRIRRQGIQTYPLRGTQIRQISAEDAAKIATPGGRGRPKKAPEAQTVPGATEE